MRDPKALMGMGFGFVCACCDRLQEGLEAGSFGCTATRDHLDCGGPLVGMSFPAYKGPLTIQTIATRCFRCGEDFHATMEVRNGGYVGVCKAHVNMTIPTCSQAMVPKATAP